jgi:hypothetical protein
MLSEPDAAEIAALGARLAGRPVVTLHPVKAGGNNRIWRLDCGGTTFALKVYPPQEMDPRDRLGPEWRALTLLSGNGVAAVPRPVARADHAALYEWIEGRPVREPSAADIDVLADFLLRIQELRDRAEGIGPASAACFSGAEATAQMWNRLGRLEEAAADFPDLRTFLVDRLRPLAESLASRADTVAIPSGHRALSPSDFGFHNALRRPDGRLVFLDFEYFGWDDPVKAVADVMWHGGMDLPAPLGERFRDRVAPVFAARDPDFPRRLDAMFPLYGLIWCLILLNEFLPERWQRRNLGGRVADPQAARARQLARAAARLEALHG